MMMSGSARGFGAEACAAEARPMGIGRGIRPSNSSAPAPVLPPPPPPVKVVKPAPQTDTEALRENLEFIKDIGRQFQTLGRRIPYKEDIIVAFEEMTGNPLEDVALALGFESENELFECKGMDFPIKSQTSSQGLGVTKQVVVTRSRKITRTR